MEQRSAHCQLSPLMIEKLQSWQQKLTSGNSISSKSRKVITRINCLLGLGTDPGMGGRRAGRSVSRLLAELFLWGTKCLCKNAQGSPGTTHTQAEDRHALFVPRKVPGGQPGPRGAPLARRPGYVGKPGMVEQGGEYSQRQPPAARSRPETAQGPTGTAGTVGIGAHPQCPRCCRMEAVSERMSQWESGPQSPLS